MSINLLLVPVLERICFVNRFKSLSLRFNNFENRLIETDLITLKEIIESFGYKTKYNKSEDFFKLVEATPPYKVQFNISIKRGIVEFIWGVERNNERLKLGGSICGAIEYLTNESFTSKPIFSNYEDLKEILREAFAIYEDFKTELFKQEKSV